MDPEIARNQNYDDHYANDGEDVHSVLLLFHDDCARHARSPYVSAAISVNSVIPSNRWLGSTEASKYKSFLSPPPISPIAPPSEEQKEHEDNENEIHIFLQNVWREISLLHMWVQNNYPPGSDSTYYYFNGGGNEADIPQLPGLLGAKSSLSGALVDSEVDPIVRQPEPLFKV